MVKSIGGKWAVRCREVVHFLKGPLLEVLLYWGYGNGVFMVKWLQYLRWLSWFSHRWVFHYLASQNTLILIAYSITPFLPIPVYLANCLLLNRLNRDCHGGLLSFCCTNEIYTFTYTAMSASCHVLAGAPVKTKKCEQQLNYRLLTKLEGNSSFNIVHMEQSFV